jgi:hypothetical protein
MCLFLVATPMQPSLLHPYHTHPLIYEDGAGWICEGNFQAGGCVTVNPTPSTTGFPSLSGYHFRCIQCDFDLCNECYFSRVYVVYVKRSKRFRAPDLWEWEQSTGVWVAFDATSNLALNIAELEQKNPVTLVFGLSFFARPLT